MTPHICFVSPYIYPSLIDSGTGKIAGGAEMQQAQIARLMARQNFRVSVLTHDFGQPEGQCIDGITIHKLPLGQHGVRGLKWLVPRLTDATAALHRIAPDIVYARTASAYVAAAAWYARRHNARFIYAGASDHNFECTRPAGISRRDWSLYKWGLKRADLILTQNHKQSLDVTQNLKTPQQLCPNFLVDPHAQNGAADGPIIWVGTIRALKQPEAFLELARRFPDRRFLLIGGAQSDPNSQKLAASLAANSTSIKNLELVGHIAPQKVGQLFDGAAALINTSTIEGFPNTFLQAWLRGVPSLSFVSPEVSAGVSGTIACVDLNMMTTALNKLLNEPQLWLSESQRVREHFNKYHTEAAALKRYLGIFVAKENK